LAACPTHRQSSVRVQAKFGGIQPSRAGPSPAIFERLMSALPYVLPFFNAFTYGRYLFYMYPAVKAVVRPILPAVASFHSLPFASMIAFFGIYIGIINNRNMSKFVRFNGMQALLLDIMLVIPRLLETVLTPPTSGWGLQVYINSQSFIWIFICAWVLFGVFNALTGTYGRIPFVGDAADAQIRG